MRMNAWGCVCSSPFQKLLITDFLLLFPPTSTKSYIYSSLQAIYQKSRFQPIVGLLFQILHTLSSLKAPTPYSAPDLILFSQTAHPSHAKALFLTPSFLAGPSPSPLFSMTSVAPPDLGQQRQPLPQQQQSDTSASTTQLSWEGDKMSVLPST